MRALPVVVFVEAALGTGQGSAPRLDEKGYLNRKLRMLQTINGNTTFVDGHWVRESPATIDLRHGDAAAGVPVGTAAHQLVNLPMLGALCFSVLVFAVLVFFRESLFKLGNWGYLGVFLVQLADSATIFIPTPGHAYAFATGAALNPVLLGVIGGVGATLGELTGYFLGARAHRGLEGGRLYDRVLALTKRWTGPALFTFALLPGPFEVANICAGAIRYPLWRFFLYVGIGKIVKVTCIAAGGFYTLSWLLGPTG